MTVGECPILRGRRSDALLLQTFDVARPVTGDIASVEQSAAAFSAVRFQDLNLGRHPRACRRAGKPLSRHSFR